MRKMESLRRLLLWSWCGQSLFRCVHPKVPWSLGRGCTDSDHGCWVESFALSIASPTFRLEPLACHEWVFKASFSCLSLSCCVHLCERAKSSLKFSLVLKNQFLKALTGLNEGLDVGRIFILSNFSQIVEEQSVIFFDFHEAAIGNLVFALMRGSCGAGSE